MRDAGEHGIPRRSNLQRMTPAEVAIYDAMQAVEAAGCHPWLTDVATRLSEARDQLADYVDATNEERLRVALLRGGHLRSGVNPALLGNAGTAAVVEEQALQGADDQT